MPSWRMSRPVIPTPVDPGPQGNTPAAPPAHRAERRASWRSRRLLAPLLALASAVVAVVLLHLPLFSHGLLPDRLPTLYSNDQLGYLSIVTDVAHGYGATAEPMTLTGVNDYPSGYYTLVGTVARVLDITPVTAWNLVSLVLQVAAATSLGIAMSRLARRTWVALLGPLALFTGTFSWILAGGDWKTTINVQGALWGPFGVLFPSNGETAGLSLVLAALAILATVWARSAAPRTRLIATSIAFALLGATANFQTYSFLAGVYVVAGLGAAYVLAARRSRAGLWCTVAAIAAVFVLGPWVASTAGSLPALLVGLLPALPAAVILLRRTGPIILLPLALTALLASPMVVGTLLASTSGDAFMTYRTSSNVGLGVVHWTTLWTSLPALAVAALVAVLGVRLRRPALVAVGTGLPVTWVLIAINDVWGANAEPYRFWIDGYLFVCVGIALALAAAWGGHRGTRRRSEGVTPPEATEPGPRRGRSLLLWTTAIVVALWGLALPDAVHWATDPAVQDTWDPGTPRSLATATVLDQVRPGDGLVVTAPCLDPRTAKIVSGAPLAYYYLGMAWPEKRDAVQIVMDDRGAGTLDLEHLRAADVRWVLTDTACEESWADHDGLEQVRSTPYVGSPEVGGGSGELTLWRVR